MPLELRCATPEDIRACHVIAQAAYADATFYRALWPCGMNFAVDPSPENDADKLQASLKQRLTLLLSKISRIWLIQHIPTSSYVIRMLATRL